MVGDEESFELLGLKILTPAWLVVHGCNPSYLGWGGGGEEKRGWEVGVGAVRGEGGKLKAHLDSNVVRLFP